MSFGSNPDYLSPKFSATKKEALWNCIEPGDPYDIRKYQLLIFRSKIARLPGESKTFMGNNLELVCLFQAAEIERICDNLE